MAGLTEPEAPLNRLNPMDSDMALSAEGLKAYIVSDVHMNNHPYERDQNMENPRRRNFRVFLTRLNQELPQDRQHGEKIRLILNGDILDVTGSWFEEIVPWDTDRAKVLSVLNRLLLEIMENNQATCDELRKLIQSPLVEIIYVFGNHDGMLQQYPESQKTVLDYLTASDEERSRFHFAPSYTDEALDLYLEHGHLQDPFNRKAHSDEPPLGDVINVLVVNRFVEDTINRLRENGYSEAFINRVHSRLHDIEYLRPLSLLPVWIQNVAHQYENHPESLGKPQAVHTILMDVVTSILQDQKMIAYMTRQLRWPRPILPLIIKLILGIPWVLPLISFFTSKLMRKTHSNKYQYRAAQKIYREHGYRLIAFGHTHIPGVQPLSENAYYFNTGSWKPVINLFNVSRDPVELEYLNPDVQFNKVERCGILCIEKADLQSRNPAEFYLQTIQSGLG